jgi:hypothetical protein
LLEERPGVKEADNTFINPSRQETTIERPCKAPGVPFRKYEFMGNTSICRSQDRNLVNIERACCDVFATRRESDISNGPAKARQMKEQRKRPKAANPDRAIAAAYGYPITPVGNTDRVRVLDFVKTSHWQKA